MFPTISLGSIYVKAGCFKYGHYVGDAAGLVYTDSLWSGSIILNEKYNIHSFSFRNHTNIKTNITISYDLMWSLFKDDVGGSCSFLYINFPFLQKSPECLFYRSAAGIW